jgi:predicted RND superfamily exporter protein/lauroyl/myristoyl acyltransferase
MNRRRVRWWWLALLVPLALGFWRLRFDADVLSLLPTAVPVVRGLQLYQEHFANSQDLLVTVRATQAEAAEAAARQIAESLRPLTNLVAAAVWQPPWLDQPEHLTELIAWLWLNQPPDALGRLARSLAPDRLAGGLAAAREQLATSLSPLELGRLAYDPFGITRLPGGAFESEFLPGGTQDWFSAGDGRFRVVFVEPRTRLVSYRHAAPWLGEIRAALARCAASPDWPAQVTVRLTGGPPFLAETASNLERDLRGSAIGTLAVIGLLFAWAHRRLLPLVWLLTLLLLVVAGTVAAGGLILGAINLVSLGFASILLGLGVDYGLVLYQESLAAPDASPAQLRQVLTPSIRWSAATTAAAFGLLQFGGLPGLSQLGLLVGIGVVLAAVVMLFAFLPVAARRRPPLAEPGLGAKVHAGEHGEAGAAPERSPACAGRVAIDPRGSWRFGLAVSGVALLVVAAVLGRGWPRVDSSTRALELTGSEAQGALDELQREFNREGSPLLLVLTGRDEVEVAARLAAAERVLDAARADGRVRSYLLPSALWPHAERQSANRRVVAELARAPGRLTLAAQEAGFTTNACQFALAVLEHWERMAQSTGAVWPTNAACHWLLDRFSARGGEGWLAAGVLRPVGPGQPVAVVEAWAAATPGVWLTGWPLVGKALLAQVERRLTGLVVAMVAILAGSLRLAFRRWGEVALSFAALVFSFLVLMTVMRLAGWTWNLMNLTAVPLLLGAGVDYTIHVQLALRRHGGDIRAVRRVTGRALLLCAGTTAAGFGSLAWASNAGLASVGLVCSSGILAVYLASVLLLPSWWRFCYRNEVPETRRSATCGVTPPQANGGIPSSSSQRRRASAFLYSAGFWRAGMALVRTAPPWIASAACTGLAQAYFHLDRKRRTIVTANLLPVLDGDRSAAVEAARRLYRRFALKLVDLLRLESGVVSCPCEADPRERAIIQTAQARGRGLLLLTLHLGNWEQGSLLLAGLGIQLTVLTLPEPEDELTAVRAAARARWGIRTLVIGQDSFALVEVVKQLGAGNALAIAVDRPAERNGVLVDWFGRPFRASTVAAELARASGCALVGVTLVRRNDRLAVRVLPEFVYDRRALAGREARRELTRQILRAFEPEIRKDPDQWYHFVPIWAAEERP